MPAARVYVLDTEATAQAYQHGGERKYFANERGFIAETVTHRGVVYVKGAGKPDTAQNLRQSELTARNHASNSSPQRTSPTPATRQQASPPAGQRKPDVNSSKSFAWNLQNRGRSLVKPSERLNR